MNSIENLPNDNVQPEAGGDDDAIHEGAIAEVGSDENRHHERDTLLLKAALRLANDYETFAIRVRNLSAAGLMAEATFPIAEGSRVVIDLRNLGWVPGTVAWVMDDRFGVAFHEAIDPKAVRQAPPPRAPDPADMVVRRPLVIGKPPAREPEQRPLRSL